VLLEREVEERESWMPVVDDDGPVTSADIVRRSVGARTDDLTVAPCGSHSPEDALDRAQLDAVGVTSLERGSPSWCAG
jgi:hypothetical protein